MFVCLLLFSIILPPVLFAVKLFGPVDAPVTWSAAIAPINAYPVAISLANFGGGVMIVPVARVCTVHGTGRAATLIQMLQGLGMFTVSGAVTTLIAPCIAGCNYLLQ